MVDHRLTHKPTDPDCDACVRVKMKKSRKCARAYSRPLKRCGDINAMDHCSLDDAGVQYALSGNTAALVVRDVYSTFGAVYPTSARSMDEATMASRSLVGDSKVNRFYSDNADELIGVARNLGAPHEASQQGMPQANGILERGVPDMLTGTRTLLVAAGLLAHCWSHAAPCYMHVDKCMLHPKSGQSAWSIRYGEKLGGGGGLLKPIGAAVVFKPSPAKLAPHKPLPSASFGICRGYRFAPRRSLEGRIRGKGAPPTSSTPILGCAPQATPQRCRRTSLSR